MFKKILAAVDGSASAEHAFELALQLGKVEAAQLLVCCVADPSPLYGTLEPTTLVEQTFEEIRRGAQHVVDGAVAKALAAGVAAQGCVLDGDPAYEIVLHADKIAADALVVGTHGRSGLRRLFMGSVAEGIVRAATIPVLIVREEAQIGEPAAGARVLVAVDGSDTSIRALDVAADFTAGLRGELVICHVVDLARAAALSGGAAQLVPASLEEIQTEGTEILDAALARVSGRVRASIRRVAGVPVEQIERLADENRPNVIVIGSHGRTGLERLVLGSVAEGVVRGASFPVMVVPAKEKPAAQG
jgi:nucleotide-binding universal stress UspA family protein